MSKKIATCNVLFLLALAALPAPAGETYYKDRVRIEDFPREIEEGAALTIRGVPQGKWKYGWCAITLPDGTTKELHDAEITGGKFAQRLVFDKGKGRYDVEFMVQGDLGPAVGAIFNIYAGVPKEVEPEPNYEWDRRPAGEIERDVFDRINAFRKGRGLSELQWEERLAAIGRDHCADMIENRYFAHLSPKAGDMAARAKVKYGWKNVTWGLPDRKYEARPDGVIFVGEDLAYDNNPQAAVDAWLGSRGTGRPSSIST
ncbi:MAG: hypothetical protein HYY18_23315 [Planctomycetes bacterium]|nr:hypothetical protein [Planctomycetota bacterium]